jgi:hypothetical protein
VAAAAALCSALHPLLPRALLMLALRLLAWACLVSRMVPARAAGWGSQQATAGQRRMQQGRWVRTAASCIDEQCSCCLPVMGSASSSIKESAAVYHCTVSGIHVQRVVLAVFICRCLTHHQPIRLSYTCCPSLCNGPMLIALCVPLQTCLLRIPWSLTTSRRA